MNSGKENFFDFEIIAASPGSQNRETLNVDIVDRPFEFNGETWAYRASPLAVPYSLHTAIGKPDDKGTIRYNSWLDWHNMRANPETARSLVFSDPDVSFEEKLESVERLSNSIQAYNTLMVDYNSDSSIQDLENLVKSGKLPKPKTIQLVWGIADSRLGLDFVARRLGVDFVDNELSISWDRLLELSQSGKLVDTWKEMASTPSDREIMFAKPEEDPNRPKTFYRDDLCLETTGYNTTQLLDMTDKNIVTPIDEAMSAIGRDSPRSDSDKMLERHWIFMNTRIDVSLLPISADKLFELTQRFRTFEQYIHPKGNHDSYRKIYDPIYERINTAYAEKNKSELRMAVIDLIDLVLHE